MLTDHHVSNSDVLCAENGDFPDLARHLFGSVTLAFGDDGVTRRVTSTSVGAYRFSELRAGAHTVHGDRVVVRSDDPDSIKVLLQSTGRSYICQGGRRLDIGPGNALIYDPVRPYTLFHPDPVYLHILQLPRECLPSQLGNKRGQPRLLRFAASATTKSLLDSVNLLLSGRGATLDPVAATLGLVLNDEARSTWTLATLRRRALEAIESRLHDPNLNVSGLARALGCSTRYLHLSFAEVGQTPSDCLWQRRLDLAHRHLIDATDQRKISDVAFALGFSSSAHFSRLFRQRYDCTPRELRLSASLR